MYLRLSSYVMQFMQAILLCAISNNIPNHLVVIEIRYDPYRPDYHNFTTNITADIRQDSTEHAPIPRVNKQLLHKCLTCNNMDKHGIFVHEIIVFGQENNEIMPNNKYRYRVFTKITRDGKTNLFSAPL